MVCGAVLCENCQMVAGYAQPYPAVSGPPSDSAVRYSTIPAYHTVCAWECFDRWAWTFISRGHAPGMFGQDYVLGGVRLALQVDGKVVTLLDISKAQGNHLLDRLEELLRERATPKAIIRKKKPTFARPAPDVLRREIVGETDVVVEGLAD